MLWLLVSSSTLQCTSESLCAHKVQENNVHMCAKYKLDAFTRMRAIVHWRMKAKDDWRITKPSWLFLTLYINENYVVYNKIDVRVKRQHQTLVSILTKSIKFFDSCTKTQRLAARSLLMEKKNGRVWITNTKRLKVFKKQLRGNNNKTPNLWWKDDGTKPVISLPLMGTKNIIINRRYKQTLLHSSFQWYNAKRYHVSWIRKEIVRINFPMQT